jgi:UDP-N-acetylglucosamine 2-epimerase (non-hydrolysing)
MTILLVAGTRPEAVKLAPVAIALLAANARVSICSTGQHPQLVREALASFDLKADMEVPAIPAGSSLATLTSTIVKQIDRIVTETKPNWVVVQGDTTSAFAAGLAAFLRQVPVAHVEAGLRTGTPLSPFPEEANRAMLARLASLHFATTPAAAANLVAEGIAPAQVLVTGNTVVDAVQIVRANRSGSLQDELMRGLKLDAGRPVVLVTCHRRENWGRPLLGICAALAELADAYPQHQWLLPMHPNPVLRSTYATVLGARPNVSLTEPLAYGDMIGVLTACSLAVSDSGGLLEEAAGFGLPFIVLRDRTERPEALAAGYAELAGSDPRRIVELARGWLDDPARRAALASISNPFGDGHAAERIAARLLATGIAV